MYRYDVIDKDFVADRTAEFREQVNRRLAGEITEDQFKPIRLMNGLYLQLHAYMLRIAIPYGTLTSKKLRKLAFIAKTYDKGYGHFTTRTNLQLHWIKLKDAPDILEHLADVGMHAMQTSGNTIRNVTADPYAGATADELDDPRVWAEAIRQWSTLHPEFSFLPRKFKIAVTGAEHDRAVIKAHDIGLRVLRHPQSGELGYQVIASTGRLAEVDYLKGLGAVEVIDRKELTGQPRTLAKERWAGAVDAVGSTTLANVLSMTRYGGVVTACGLAGGMDLPTTVAPFILRGVSLIGIDSVMCPLPLRQEAWRRLETDLDRGKIESMISEIGLGDVLDAGPRILAGDVRGRIVVKVR